jgi:hypothetical protein
MSLGNTLFQLFCCYCLWCLYLSFLRWLYCAFTLALDIDINPSDRNMALRSASNINEYQQYFPSVNAASA